MCVVSAVSLNLSIHRVGTHSCYFHRPVGFNVKHLQHLLPLRALSSVSECRSPCGGGWWHQDQQHPCAQWASCSLTATHEALHLLHVFSLEEERNPTFTAWCFLLSYGFFLVCVYSKLSCPGALLSAPAPLPRPSIFSHPETLLHIVQV